VLAVRLDRDIPAVGSEGAGPPCEEPEKLQWVRHGRRRRYLVVYEPWIYCYLTWSGAGWRSLGGRPLPKDDAEGRRQGHDDQ